MRKTIILFAFLFTYISSNASQILIPMDDSQSNHLKAYGISYYLLENEIDEVVFFAKKLDDFPDWKPYYKAIENACLLNNILLNIRLIP